MNIIAEIQPNNLFARILNEKRKYTPRNSKISPITKGKKLGPKYTVDECSVLVHMVLYPGQIGNSPENDIDIVSDIFNRSEASISMTMSNAKSVLFKTSKLENVSNNMRLACEKYKNLSKNDFRQLVAKILLDYDYNKRD
jgi:hypothetical protein